MRRGPRGYLVLRGRPTVAERLGLNQVKVREVAAGVPRTVEAYRVHLDRQPQRREAINPDQSVRVTIEKQTIDVPAGTLFVPMDQPAAGIAAAALEPDSPGSYVGVGVIPMDTTRPRRRSIV